MSPPPNSNKVLALKETNKWNLKVDYCKILLGRDNSKMLWLMGPDDHPLKSKHQLLATA